ncbi:MAG TPA: YCF48-related protein [Bryobacteraceae bacterium]|jgi:photosystem II stability/assembly factor-like uncharacterized protein|nr:YCF48-related protein [Bryobacteraceae bacterium]
MRSPVLLAIAAASTLLAQSWIPQQSNSSASLRGVHAVSPKVVWASGTRGTVLKTTDGGSTWQAVPVTGAADLDFRAIHAFDEKSALAMSAGPGEKSRIYKTTDGGTTWRIAQPNTDPKGFWDAMAFWDESHGIVLGDPVDGRFTILTTSDGGATWQKQRGAASRGEEGAFAASNTCLVVRGSREAWFASGGPGGARVFHSTDGGRSWDAAPTPIRNDGASMGVFSLAFSGARGVAVGGDYNQPGDATRNIAISTDLGKTWRALATAPAGGPAGFRSAVVSVADLKLWIAIGTSGSDWSSDAGETWKQFDKAAYNAMSFAGDSGWAVGPQGAIALFSWRRF